MGWSSDTSVSESHSMRACLNLLRSLLSDMVPSCQLQLASAIASGPDLLPEAVYHHGCSRDSPMA